MHVEEAQALIIRFASLGTLPVLAERAAADPVHDAGTIEVPDAEWSRGDGRPPRVELRDDGAVLVAPASRWSNLRVRTAQLASAVAAHRQEAEPLAREPTSPDAAPPIPAQAEAPPPLERKRRAGGRPERNDWPLFDREMMRRLTLDGGNLRLREFRRIMKDWAAQHMRPAPDERTVERRIDERAPTELLAPD